MLSGKINRRKFLRNALLASTGLTLVSCAPATPPAEETSGGGAGAEAPADEKHSITIAWHTGGEGPNKIFAEAADKFDETHPNYTVTRINEPYGPYMEKMLVMYASGTAPDAHTIPWGWYGVFAEKGGLMPVDDLAMADADELKPDDFWPAAWEGMLYKGKRLGLPRETLGIFIMAYNKEIFAKAGIKTPMEYYEEDDWTWTRWRETAAALTTRKDGRFEQVGCNFPVWREGLDVMMQMWQSTQGLYDENYTKINLDDPKFLEFVDYFTEVVTVDQSVIPPGEQSDIDWMASGKQAMNYAATFSIPDYKVNWKFDWDFAPSPKGPGGFKSVAGYDYYGINAKAKDVQGGWEWIKYMNLPEMTLWWGEKMFGLPFHKSVSTEWLDVVKKDPPPTTGWDVAGDIAAASDGLPNTVAENIFQNEWTNRIIPIFRGEVNREEVLPEVKKVVDEELSTAQK